MLHRAVNGESVFIAGLESGGRRHRLELPGFGSSVLFSLVASSRFEHVGAPIYDRREQNTWLESRLEPPSFGKLPNISYDSTR